MPVPNDPFFSLNPMEAHISEQLRSARSGNARGHFFVEAPDDINPYVSGKFLRWLLLEAIPALPEAVTQVEIRKITVADTLDLEGTKIVLQMRFVKCRFLDKINLNDASIMGLALISGSVRQIEADRLNASGSVEIRKSVELEPETGPIEIAYRVRLCGAEIRGNLDMRGCILQGHTRDPNEENVPLFADGLTVKSNVLLSDGFNATGEIRLNGNKIRRNLDCSGATLQNAKGYSLSAAGAQIEGTAYLCRSPESTPYAQRRPFKSVGTVRLEGARIDGDLDCTGGIFIAGPFLSPDIRPAENEHDRLYAIRANGMQIGASILFDSRADGEFTVQGAIGLINATVGDDFECIGARFDFPGEEILVADGLTVSGTTFLDEAYVNGILRFPQANLKEGLQVIDARFDPTPLCRGWFGTDNVSWNDLDDRSACGIYAPLAQVGGSFCWKENVKVEGTAQSLYWLHLRGSSANNIEDDKESWQRLDRFNVTGCQYNRFSEPGDHKWRIELLDEQYAIENRGGTIRLGVKVLYRAYKLWRRRQIERNFDPQIFRPAPDPFAAALKAFNPQPYLQLARVYRNAGYEKIANDLLVRYQRNKTRYSDLGVLRQIGRWLVDLFVLYGFSPFRPIFYLVIWAFISAWFFELAYLDGKILPAKDLQPFKDTKYFEDNFGAAPYPPRPSFNALLFAIDTLVPVVDFNQKKSWTVERIAAPPKPLFHGPTPLPDEAWEIWRALPRPGAGLLLLFNTFFGWLLTSFFVAGVGGLLRTGREEG